MEKKRARTENIQTRNESLSSNSEKEPESVQSLGSSMSKGNEASKRRAPSGFQKRTKAKLKLAVSWLFEKYDQLYYCRALVVTCLLKSTNDWCMLTLTIVKSTLFLHAIKGARMPHSSKKGVRHCGS